MMWMSKVLAHTGSRTGNNISCWMLLLIYISFGQQTGINENKKIPEDLVCYQNYTSQDNFCYCSWRAGEESQNPIFTLQYCLLRDDECQHFGTGKLTYKILTNDIVHMEENISLAVTAEENGKNYTSNQIFLILEKAVKLDPPDHKKITITRRANNVTVSWTRVDFFSAGLNTTKEVRYKEHNLYLDSLPCTSSTPRTCYPGRDGIPNCKEYCSYVLDGQQGHDIQIRQKYEEGVWSEWSDSIFVPAEIGPIQKEKIIIGALNLAGMRHVSLLWKNSTKEEGDMNYHVNVTFLDCVGVTTNHLTNTSLFSTSISGAAYNVTVIAANQAQTTAPWSTIIEEDMTAIPFQNVTLSGNNLTMKWKRKKAGRSSFCIAWKTSEMKGVNLSNPVENLSNEATILTDNFLPMKCYKIYIHRMSKSHATVGTTHYFKPLPSIGPGNLTVINITFNSVHLKWDAFDLHECQEILQNWIIITKDLETNISKATYENSSVTQYLAKQLRPGLNYIFEIKGITIFGEQTGSSFKPISIPQKVENTNKKILEKTVWIIAALLFVPLCTIFSCYKINQCICQDLPNPTNSTATTFVPSDNKNISNQPCLVPSSSEEENTDPLIVETSMKTEAIETAVKETEMQDLDRTKTLLDSDLVMTEVDTEVEIDFQFEYRKQVAPMSPIVEKDTDQFFENINNDLPHQTDNPKENDALLSLNDVNTSTSES
ncbi:interleukin-12 receptor subunit beta-1 [Anomaloglossus baeobatrachus]|uniref:interleukin-12 receptor subunit beta-1 n=1 Tax=Anomaloglossus baeobatrachus TaxID=238106 RepID=UPI003F4FC4E0